MKTHFKNDQLKLIIRLVYLIWVISFVITLRKNFSYLNLTALLIIKWTIFAGILNSGLIIISSDWAKKWKFTSFFLYLPVLFLSPFQLPVGNWISFFILFLFFLTILIIYFPWRNHAYRSLHIEKQSNKRSLPTH